MVGDFDPLTIQRLGILAEKSGFDFVWTSHDMFKVNSWVTLTSIACSTSRVKLGNSILNPYSCNPAEIATYIATLDQISEGRAVLGLSAGAKEFLKWIGIDATRPLTRTKETVQLLRTLMRGERAEMHGREFQWTGEAYLRFKPLRSNIPIYIGGSGPKFLEYAGEAADGVLPILFPPEYADKAMSHILRGVRKAGRKLEDVDVVGCVWFSISEGSEFSGEEPLKALIAHYGPVFENTTLNEIGLTTHDFDAIRVAVREKGLKAGMNLVTPRMLDLALHGNVDQCIERIEKLEKKGVTNIGLGSPLGADPEEAVKLVGKKVIPCFKKSAA
jgi:5,10-methylenetetrahydromethanopterin reductase